MERILSQLEIDELIQDLEGRRAEGGAAPAEVTAGEVTTYDFRRPSKFSREQLRTIERIYQQFGRLMAMLLSARLRTDLSVRVASVQQMAYGEFIRSVPNPSVIAVYRLEPTGETTVFQMGFELALNLFERLAGGSGRGRIRSRELTEIEVQVLKSQVFSLVARAYRQAWEGLMPVGLELRDLETNPAYLNLMLEQDVVLWVSLSVDLGGETEAINVCLPYATLEPVLPKLTADYLLKGQAQPHPEDRRRMERALRETVVEVEAMLGSVELEIEELMGLEVGDVIVLDTAVDGPLPLVIGGKPRFVGTPGLLGDNLAVVVTGVASAPAALPEAGGLEAPAAVVESRMGSEVEPDLENVGTGES